MNDLPEDLNLWPSDPFDLLNLKRSDDARTAKRAYFKLIRKFKPDKFPAEFQKIREAYESVESWLQWQTQDQQYRDSQTDDAEETEQADSSSNQTGAAKQVSGDSSDEVQPSSQIEFSSSQSESADQDARRRILAAPIDRFYESLNSTGLAAAVEHLRNMDPSSGSEQIAQANIVKYFIARFLPSSAKKAASVAIQSESEVSQSDQKRIAWLLKSIKSSTHSQAALTQLRSEFDQTYQLANCEVFNRYLSKIDDSETLASLYLLRWQAIGHYQPQTVVADLKKLQPRALEFGGIRGVWMNLVAESMNYTVWRADQQCVEHNEECWREISENDQSWVADSAELLILASEQWKSMYGNKWTAAIPWARNTLPETSRAMWMPVAQEISANPRNSLKTLDSRFQASSMAMTIFEEGLQNLASINSDAEGFDEPQWDETRELVACYFADVRKSDYASNRIAMMEFCILNQMSPMTFAAAANSFLASDNSVGWFELVQTDGPLKCVVHACHATNW